MSKGAFNGLLKGKLGNTIFYKVTNSADKEKQGQRQYVASIANPRTAPQATQRMRMKPAINFYRGLADLLDHSWEGVKYGALSRQKFMQLALSPTLAGIPYVDKGESRFIPGAYPLSLGSVGANAAIRTIGRSGGANQSYYAEMAALGFSDDHSGSYSWGDWSDDAILLSNGMLRDGDEITFIAVYEIDGVYVPMHSYVVLDVSSTLSVPQVLSKVGVLVSDVNFQFVRENSINGAGEWEYTEYNQEMVAAGIIVSRHPSRTSTTWLRSTSNLFCSKSFTDRWMSADRFAAALATYQNAASELTSDWLLNQADTPAVGGGSGGGSLIQNFTLTNEETAVVGGGGPVQLAYYNDGTKEGFICDAVTLMEGSSPGFLCAGVRSVEGRTILPVEAKTLPSTAKIISFDEYPSIRSKIAQFYTFA